MLEIGGGTGRISIPVAGAFDTVLSFDIAEAMVRTAMRKRDSSGEALSHVHYFIADAENIPVRSACVDVAIFSGILDSIAACEGRAIQEYRISLYTTHGNTAWGQCGIAKSVGGVR